MWAPGKTARAVVARLHQEAVRSLQIAMVRDRFLGSGVEPVGSTPEQFAATMLAEAVRLDRVIKAGGIRAN